MGVNYNPRVVTNGLVLYLDAANKRSYPGSGTTWYDLSKSGKNGTLIGGPSYISTVGNGSFSLDGSNDYITLPNLGTLNNLTFEITLYSPNATGNVVWTASDDTIIFYQEGNAYIKSDTGTLSVSAPFNLSNRTTTLTVVYNIATQKAYYYQDGVQTKEVSLPANSTTFAVGYTNIFTQFDATMWFKQGKVYSVKMYDRALTASEIKQNFNALRGRFNI